MAIGDRIKHAWDAFLNQKPSDDPIHMDVGPGYSTRPERVRLRIFNERSIISSIYTRISIDVASVSLRHIIRDDQDRFMEEVKSGLNNCLKVEANLDQAAQHFRQDIVLSLFDEGATAIVPVKTTTSPINSGGYNIQELRIGKIVQFFPKHIRVSLYNDNTGRREEITIPKKIAAIVENPLYPIMNEPNSTLQRLQHKLRLLDTVDEQTSSGKLDLIIQLPYVIKSDTRRAAAQKRREEMEFQLMGSKYGVAYTDGSEKITQLNRPVENNLLAQIKDLKEQLYAELGLTLEVMNGTADEKTMKNYQNRTVEPILVAISEAMSRSFLSKTARTQGHWVTYFLDPFKLVPIADFAEIADKLARNEVLTSNELRGFIHLKPSKDPKADQLRNSNMPQSELGQDIPPTQEGGQVDDLDE